MAFKKVFFFVLRGRGFPRTIKFLKRQSKQMTLWRGSCVALVTPMLADGAIDLDSVSSLVDWHIQSGTQAIVVHGTTGEACTLSFEERRELLATVVEVVNQRIPVIAGTGSNCTAVAIQNTQQAQHLGADACLVITPYCNKPTQAGLIAHYSAIANAVALPLLLYNVPGRTACDLSIETIVALSKMQGILGIKDAHQDVTRVVALRGRCPRGFALYSGEDGSFLEFMRLGGDGVVSVTANVAPKAMQTCCQRFFEQDFEGAKGVNESLMLLHTRLFVESNPIPVKWAVAQLKGISPTVRLPLTELSACYHGQILEAIQRLEQKTVKEGE